jgi:DNA-directed RNA polymerase specialized sigma24 family protein
VAWKLLNREEQVADLCQEVWLKVHRHLAQFDGSTAQFSTWLGRIAIHQC